MRHLGRRAAAAALVGALAVATDAGAGIAAALRSGYDSNVDHSVQEPHGEPYGSLLLRADRSAPGDERLEWTAGVALEATSYPGLHELDLLAVTAEAGLLWRPAARWTLSGSPFARAAAVRDDDQSAAGFGARVGLRRDFGASSYLAGWYRYADSRAREDVYSVREHAIGTGVGTAWSSGVWAELAFEFRRGESFRAVDASGAASARGGSGGSDPRGSGGGGSGGTMHYSSVFGSDLVAENVDQRQVWCTVGYDARSGITWTAGYGYGIATGDSGTAADHEVFVELSVRL